VLFNPLHDHESVWWIACWALFNHVPADRTLADDEGLHNQIDYARRLFHPTVYAPERAELLRGISDKFANNLPKEFDYLKMVIYRLGGEFVKRYTKAEAISGKIDSAAFHGFWKTLHKWYGKVSEKLKTMKVQRLGLRMEKRKRDSELEVGGGEQTSEDNFSEAVVKADTKSKGKGRKRRRKQGGSEKEDEG
jgi:hypothetical protein